LELHIHSGRALISALLSSLALLPNLRPAEPGEFTRQALLGGRLDLTQVEGLHDLIEADTEVQRVWALGSAGVCTPDSMPIFITIDPDARERRVQNMIHYASK
jgi:tRNA U34 5-carboxymethylaminomethyl modifying GTPase MnmE/TrmE